MEIKEEIIERIAQSVNMMREAGVNERLVAVVPWLLFVQYRPIWDDVKEKTGVYKVESDPTIKDIMVLQRSDYLRIVINKLNFGEA